jgi:PAS domain S-box-containing protein
VIDAEGTTRYVSPAVERVMGYQPQELVGKSIFDYVRQDALAEAKEIFAQAWSQPGVHPPFEFELPHKDGSWRRAEFLLNNLLDDPSVKGVVVNQRDVTERKETEKRLRESEQLYRNVVEQAAEIILIVDVETKRVLEANPAAHSSLGYEPEELRQMTLYDIVAHEKESVDLNTRRILKEGQRSLGERHYHRKDGSILEVEVGASAVPYGCRRTMSIVAHDITERKKAEEERSRLAAIVESSEDVILGKSLDGTITSWNRAAQRLYGYAVEEAVGRNVSMLVPPDRLGELAEILWKVREGEKVEQLETVRLTKDGRRLDVSVTVSPVRDPEGNIVGAATITRNVTERKRVEESLRRSLDALLALYEAGQILGSTLRRDEIASRLLEIVGRTSGLEAAVITLEEGRGEFGVWRGVGPEGLLASLREEPRARAASREAQEGGVVSSSELRLPVSEGGPQRRLVGLFVPLRVRERVIGVLEAYGPGSLARESAELLTSLASQAASALENARLYEELTERERQLHELVGQLVVAQEEERRQVAYDIHDGLTQLAVAAHQRLQMFAEDHPPGSPEGRAELEDVAGLVRRTVGEARHVIADLRPTALDDFGLPTAMRAQIDDLRAAGYEASYEETLGEDRLPSTVETTLYRVAQEAITNARKHAKTKRVHVVLERLDGIVRLEVTDWGSGFDPGKVGEAHGPGERVGLSSMRERVGLLGGELEIRSVQGLGTSVVAEIPLPGGADLGG